MTYQVRGVQAIPDRESFLRRLHESGFKIIYLKRENILDQAISAIRAEAFTYHQNVKFAKSTYGKVTIELDDLMNRLKKAEDKLKYEELLLEGIPNVDINYERDLLNSKDHQVAVERICRYLGIEAGETQAKLRKVSPKGQHDSIENYSEVVSFLQGTPYEQHLDGR